MASSISSNIDEKTIVFDSLNLLKKGSWVVTKGEAIIGDKITLGAEAEVRLKLNYIKSDVVVGQYLKLVCDVISTDETLSTLETHNVSMNLILTQINNEYKTYNSIYTFYTTYKHETHYKDNYTITDITSDEIIGIEILLVNNEKVEIQLDNIGLFISIIMSEKNVQNIIDRYLYESINLIIPILEERPEDDDETIRDGAIFRVPEW